MNIQDYKEATKRLKEFSEWSKGITKDEDARKAAAVVRFLMSIFAAKEQLVSEFRTKPKFPSGGISSVGT